ncbi:hypothetical protein ACFQ7Z_29805, partial [Streptomyces virginiae]
MGDTHVDETNSPVVVFTPYVFACSACDLDVENEEFWQLGDLGDEVELSDSPEDFYGNWEPDPKFIPDASTKDRQGHPNEDLARLIKQAGASHKSLAAQINKLGAAAGVPLRYEHTSVARWVNLGMTPRGRTPEFLAAALGERLGRAVSVTEIGMYSRSGGNPDLGLDFAREPVDAIRVAATYWRTVDRSRRQLISNGFAIAAFATPVTRWLAKPTDAPIAHEGGRQVGRSDLDELWKAADEARLWDSRFGGGNWKASSVTECLRLSAAPLLTGTYTEAVGRELFAATAELSRVVGWSAVDTGHHDVAQRHFVQALRLARAAGNEAGPCEMTAGATHFRGR